MDQFAADARRAELEEQKMTQEAQRLAEAHAREAEEAKRLELEKLRAESVLREREARAKRERILAEMERQRLLKGVEQAREAKAQKKLRDMGVCEKGFVWQKQVGGYRCAGGWHFISDSQLGL